MPASIAIALAGDLVGLVLHPGLGAADDAVPEAGRSHPVHQAVEEQAFGHDQGRVQGAGPKGVDQGGGIGRDRVVGHRNEIHGPAHLPGEGLHGAGAFDHDAAIIAGVEFTLGAAGFQGRQQGPAVRPHKTDFFLCHSAALASGAPLGRFFAIISHLKWANPLKTSRGDA